MERCTTCAGGGVKYWIRGWPVCECVNRAAFRSVMRRYSELGRVDPWEMSPKRSEFRADVEVIARRSLSIDFHKLFRLYYLGAADWRICTRELGLTKAQVFGRAYLIADKVGAAFRECSPFALFPIDEYFTHQRATCKAIVKFPAPARPVRTMAMAA